MSFDKSYPNRKAYRESKSVDYTCRCHGTCAYCRSNRTYSADKRKQAMESKLEEWIRGEVE